MNRTEAYLALNLLPRIGPVRVRRLVKALGSPERILSASEADLRRVEGIGADLASHLRDWENQIDLAEEWRRIESHEIHLLTVDNDDYPEYLREIHDAPFLLYVKGNLTTRDRQCIGVVGSRRATHYGQQAARKLSYQLAHAGITVVSGLARGIDTAAHEAALAAGGRTLAVLGAGIGHLYPPENAALADRIVGSGALLSEYPVLYVPDAQSFAMRNRIISGLSQGVLVVEAPIRSGALITANQALEQGRTVYAVPGPIDRPTSAGCNRLIQQGAKLTMDAGDILEDLEMLFPVASLARPRATEVAADDELDFSSQEDDGGAVVSETKRPSAAVMAAGMLSGDEQSLLAELSSSGVQIEELTARTGLAASTVSTTLLMLEMKRLVKQLPGKCFVRVG